MVAALHPRPTSRRYAPPLVYGALLANAADLDFVWAFALGSREWHRGFTHSVGFALLVIAVFMWSFGARKVRLAIGYGLAYASHAALDYATTKEGRGLELLWPLSSERMRLGLWGLSEVPSRMPAAGVLKAMAVEFALFAPVLVLALMLRRAQAKGE